jgi:hypothetical protein
MKSTKTFLCMLAGISFLIFLDGCSKTPKSYAPVVDPIAAADAAVKQYDADKNGKISGPELDQAASLKFNLNTIDSNHDQALTAQEIADRIRFWQTDKLVSGRSPVRCTVFRNKKVLANAEVKLVPEKFLGDALKIAKGKTDPNGTAILMTENAAPDDPPGVGPGFYRVEITKSGESIPAHYNVKTTLGVEVSLDNPALQKRIHFDLKY